MRVAMGIGTLSWYRSTSSAPSVGPLCVWSQKNIIRKPSPSLYPWTRSKAPEGVDKTSFTARLIVSFRLYGLNFVLCILFTLSPFSTIYSPLLQRGRGRVRPIIHIKNKESFGIFSKGLLFQKNGGYLLSHGFAVPSARTGLTSLFGMGRGGTPTL